MNEENEANEANERMKRMNEANEENETTAYGHCSKFEVRGSMSFVYWCFVLSHRSSSSLFWSVDSFVRSLSQVSSAVSVRSFVHLVGCVGRVVGWAAQWWWHACLSYSRPKVCKEGRATISKEYPFTCWTALPRFALCFLLLVFFGRTVSQSATTSVP